MLLDPYNLIVFKPNSEAFPKYFPREQIDACKGAVLKTLRLLSNEELLAIIARLREGKINSWVESKSVIACITELRGNALEIDEVTRQLFGDDVNLPSRRNPLSSRIVVTTTKYEAFTYWFRQIIGSEKPCLHSKYCTPRNCYFTQTTIRWCKRIIKRRSVKKEKN